MIRTKHFSAAVLGLLLVAACQNDKLNRPFNVTPVDPLFDRYVSMGNSITAGFQSGGINDSTQSQSYAVLLARAMHTPFFSPLMNKPGCPPPYTNVFTGARFGGGTPTTCALRKTQAVTPPFISNTAVPGALVNDIYTNGAGAHANSLTQFFLGGLTQVQMAAKVDPTFVSIWIGNNDVLGAATSSTDGGDSTLITPAPLFNARYDSMLTAVDAATSPQGGVLVGVANVTAIPFFTAGATYWAIKNHLAPPDSFPTLFTVSANCAPIVTGIPGARGDSTLIPFPYGAALLGAVAAGAARNLDCADTVARIVVPSELVKLVAAVTAYNAHISSAATTRGWAYLNPNPTLDSLRLVPAAVRPFPAIGAACTAALPFGTAFSCDAVHPSAATHRLIAQKLRLAINATYTTAIPTIP
jgi:lysophospholipase L1-like esterase